MSESLHDRALRMKAEIVKGLRERARRHHDTAHKLDALAQMLECDLAVSAGYVEALDALERALQEPVTGERVSRVF